MQRLLRIAFALGCVTLTSRSAPAFAQPATHVAPRANAADVRFMQGMIAHHGQALAMTALVPARTPSEAMHLIAERITVSQRDEIAFMRAWLVAHHENAPDATTHDMHDMPNMPGMTMSDSAPMMPGMLTPPQLATLGTKSGTAFERMFLESMIRHHEGALTMVKQLFASQGAAQDGDVFRFASDVDVDQRAEIDRMRALLAKLPAP